MPLTSDDFIQENFGSQTTGTTVNVTLGAGTTAGNTVIVFMTASVTITPASGFITDRAAAGTYGVYRKSEVAASETTWAFTLSSSSHANWYVLELSNLDPVDPLDITASNGGAGVANGGTYSTGTSTLNAGLSSVAFGMIATTSATTVAWSGWTNDFEEIRDSGSGGSTLFSLAVARKFRDGSTGTFESTATLASSGTTTSFGAVVVYRAADAAVVAPLAGIWGFDWGTHGGFAHSDAIVGLGGYSLGATGTWGTHYLIQAGSARTSNYGLRIVNSASNGGVYLGNLQTASCVYAFNVRVVSATGTVVVAQAHNSNTTLYLLYDSSTSKFGLRWGTGGTPSWQTGTTATNTWTYIQFRSRCNTATYHVDWWIETGTGDGYQTSPSDHSAGGISLFDFLFLGTAAVLSNPTQTATIDFDDVVSSRYYSVWPLGVHGVKLLTVDTGGTPSVSGTSSNFSVFTANGTLAAWNATNARNAVDDVPPTISASADGVVQTAVAASDYMEFPMATYTCAYDEVVAAVRMLAPEWGGTGSGTGTLGIRGYDGTTETTLVAASTVYDADSLTAASSTYPRWDCAMWGSSNGWTQAELNAAAVRVGFSTDATPDMGVHAIYLEVAIKTIPPIRTLTIGEADEFKVDLYAHPYTSATVSYVITNDDATRDVTFDYSISGTPQTPVVVGPSANSTLQLNADVFGGISDITLTPEVL